MEQFVPTPLQQKAIDSFAEHHGILRTSRALDLGIYQKTLYALKDLGIIEPLVRGIYRLVDCEIPPHIDLIAVSLLHPGTIFCLISALDFHSITTTIPRSINIALPQGAKPPRISGYVIHPYYYSLPQLEVGVQEHEIAGVTIRVFSPEKTVVDCFKYANKIGLSTAVEALKLCIAQYESKQVTFLQFARMARVNRRMAPYLDAIYD